MSASLRQAAFITGSSRGIGLAAAVELARHGFAIALNGPVDDEELRDAEERVRALDVPVTRVAGDIADIGAHEAMLDLAEKALGPLSTLINNAGVSVLNRGDPLDVSEESYDRCQAVNAKAQFFLCQKWARRVLARDRNDGRFYSIVNVSSSNADAVAEPRAEYCVSKAGSAMVSKVFAVRLGRENIAVYDIRPGLIETAMTQSVTSLYQRRIDEEGLTLMRRLGRPEDVGAVMATLATGRLPYTTGQVIAVDAGMLVPRF
ncbi:3-ketoacyl-ACP reductase [Labrys okinawensis]|uniref:3-ketoacyl-ACP reductase n=1 Tax=Labrys okinawensis TaxID=346911 RepID=A0A2S9QIT2_9HYPH|nr:3-ketoacyl-ACP reductase [Labrys okinawensis]PRH89276.1 3-ketoacyl-ACP reductase [Labrys okinawensis]